jgi:hypothetical protein
MDMAEERLSNRTEVKDMDTTGKHVGIRGGLNECRGVWCDASVLERLYCRDEWWNSPRGVDGIRGVLRR